MGVPSIYKATDLTYGEYLKLSELLSLQQPLSEPHHHDEMLFIVIHQSYELWFRLILHELEQVRTHLVAGKTLSAHHFTHRCVEIMKMLIPQIHILETMTPKDFLEFRERLAPASGFQSTQFREVEFLAGLKDESYLKHFKNLSHQIKSLKKRLAEPSIREAFLKFLKTRFAPRSPDEALLMIYDAPHEYSPEYLLCESLTAFDENLILWREHHLHVVERIIGGKSGTGGSSGTEYLQSTTGKRCFPELWEVRTRLQSQGQPGPKGKGGNVLSKCPFGKSA